MLPTEAVSEDRRRASARRRVASTVALLAGAATVVIAVVALTQHLAAGVATVVGLFVAVALAWQGALQSGRVRALLCAGAGLAVVAVLAALATVDLIFDLVVVVVGVVITLLAVREAFGKRGSAGGRWRPVSRPKRPVLLINPRSGNSRAERAGLAEEARERGVEAVVLGPGEDLAALARDAVARGADALGMAGGDGSMGLVAAIASEHELPFVCVPAGTRNHFALDLGVRRDDVVGALDAFTDGVEARVDLATVNQRTFVNNASMGVYGDAVQAPGYREAKLRTLGHTARSVLGPGAAAGGIMVVDDLGREHRSPALVLVSNNPYALNRTLGRSTRPQIDAGRLGIVLIGGSPGASRAWEAQALAVDAPESAAVAIDGEAVTLEAPLSFAIHPARLRVRISSRHPGVSPSGLLPPTLRVVVPRLVRLVRGG
jgi:diacylglycerol kinase family enzyme